ncbi:MULTISPECIES: enoyl-CoA hydratase [unclassified Nocardioides]|uniref:enoyl-CoA hydratase n=1 Tax=unclassified Nocardioides TaxID=2615069 RepID=UPI0006FA7320|nr:MULTISPECIES: enoyl-CoA hydratase [unclassified Nocardioides]KQY63547.1 enoyl-CoA hydratase [Nocardioides sp. Root140]KQZ67449.1 enoyl-CoA hydratase [Nocardioides sp. Root151]KRF17502.1 enoyl-CoA hydratase [Nocardioides sp. Soil796]
MTNQVPGLQVTESDGVLTIRFDRPEALNAFTGEMVVGTAGLLNEASVRDDVRVVLLTGTAGAFSTGADIAGENAHEGFDVRALDAANLLIRAVVQCDKPVVAGVNGIAAGVGLSVALACDLAVCAESAAFLLAFARVGLMPDGGSSATVAASIGRARAMRLALLAEPLPGREAYDAGLVSHVFPDSEYADGLAGIVKRLRHGAPLAQAATKRAVNAATLAQLEASLENERTTQTMLLRTADVAEGMRAFGEKRHPHFTGE